MAKNIVETPVQPQLLVEQLRALRQQIPEYAQLTVNEAKTLQGPALADPGFVNASIGAIGASPVVLSAVGMTPEAMQQAATEVQQWTVVEDELRAMLKGVAAANLTRRHRIGRAALQAYGVTRMLVRNPDNADLLPHLAEMKRLNRFGRGRSKSGETVKKPTVKA
jgi:hypothetical protein